jgi:hypothetical protein
MLQARVARDPLARARAMQRADADLTHVESNNGVWDAFARSAWCRMMAAQSADAATALRYLDRAAAEIDWTEERLPYRDGRLWLERGRLERSRCRIAPTRCDASRAEADFRRAVEMSPALRSQVSAARNE